MHTQYQYIALAIKSVPGSIIAHINLRTSTKTSPPRSLDSLLRPLTRLTRLDLPSYQRIDQLHVELIF